MILSIHYSHTFLAHLLLRLLGLLRFSFMGWFFC